MSGKNVSQRTKAINLWVSKPNNNMKQRLNLEKDCLTIHPATTQDFIGKFTVNNHDKI